MYMFIYCSNPNPVVSLPVTTLEPVSVSGPSSRRPSVSRDSSLNLGDSLDMPSSSYDSNRLSVGQWISQHETTGPNRGMFLRANSNPNPLISPVSPSPPGRPRSVSPLPPHFYSTSQVMFIFYTLS